MTTCLHELFEFQVDRHPDRTAIICRSATLTYRETEYRANQLARYLRSMGVGPGSFVGICFERSEMPIISLLAVLKSGAAYVPLDPAYPRERMKHIVTDAGISILLTEQGLLENVSSFFDGKVTAVDTFRNDIDAFPAERLSKEETGLTSEDLCYIIYTSGTTGRPKGIMTRHRNVVDFIHSFNEVCQVTEKDRVYQGFSLGFDGSVEEIWMCFAHGAALVVGTPEVVKFGPETAELINAQKVTFFSTVPTFLSMIKSDLPTVRLLVLSGEQLPQELVDRWAKGRKMLNVYGPTETTVNTTVELCEKGKPVTIGKPLKGYTTYILDKNMRPVADGVPGELYIGGIGVARGYLNQPELTESHFIKNTFIESDNSPVIFRTGDLVKRDSEGILHFLGRTDTQVKVRGFRIELSEIESVLREHPAIDNAVVTLHQRESLKELAAFILLEKGHKEPDRNEILELLQKRLPSYMVPRYCDVIDSLPLLSSGKVDRKALPAPKTPLVRSDRTITLPRNDFERKVLTIWEEIFEISPISTKDDFFMDLGGDSLLAAQMVTALRKELNRDASIRNVYQRPTIQEFCEYLSREKTVEPEECRDTQEKNTKSAKAIFDSVPLLTRRTCTILQALSLYVKYSVLTIPAAGVLLLVFGYLKGTVSWQTLIIVSVAVSVLFYPFLLAFSIVIKWLVIGRYKPGNYPVWGWYYFRWWLVTRIQNLNGSAFLAGTPLMNIYYRLMGARVGRRCIINTSLCYIFDLVSIGDDTSIGSETQLLGYRVENGMLKIGYITIGNGCFIGISSALGLNTRMGDESRLDDLSLLADNGTIKDNRSMRGSPAKPADVSVPESTEETPPKYGPVLYGILHIVALFGVGAFLAVSAIPTLVAAIWAYRVHDIYLWLVLVVIAIPLYEVSFCITLALAKIVVMRRVKPGVYSVYSLYYIRRWYIDTLLDLSRFIVLPIYTTLYFIPWVRMLGARVGPRAEFSIVSHITPDLLHVEEESFFADGSIIGGMRMYKGRFQLAENRIGRRTFVGNSAVLPPGTRLGDNCLIGVLSAPPAGGKQTPHGTEWLGSPSFRLPHRQKVEGFSESTTYRPTKKLYVKRLFIDALRICIPSILEIFGLISYLTLLYLTYSKYSLSVYFALAPIIGFIVTLLMALAVVGIKQVIIGAYRPIIRPLWSPFVWLNEVINGVYEAIAAPFISLLLGTPYIAWYLRLLGCKIGKHNFIDTTLFGEFDLVEIGSYTALNHNTVVQNHLFEDRIMKASYLKIGDECSAGNMSVILYDTEMKQGSSVGPLSLLMKGETLPAFSRWRGIPISIDRKRRFFRINYSPADGGPAFTPLDRQYKSSPVLDISENGIRYAFRDNEHPLFGSTVKGTLRFQDGRSCDVEGQVLRIDKNQQHVVLNLRKGIPSDLIKREVQVSN